MQTKYVLNNKKLKKLFPDCQFLGSNKIAESSKFSNCVINDCFIGENVVLNGLIISGAKVESVSKTEVKKINLMDKTSFEDLLRFDNNFFDGIKILIISPSQDVCDFLKKLFSKLHAEVVCEVEDLFSCKCGEEIAARLSNTYHCDMAFVVDSEVQKIFAVNHKGQVVNGDELLYLLTWWLSCQKEFAFSKVYGFQQTNLGIENKLRAMNVGLGRCASVKEMERISEKENFFLGASQDGFVLLKLNGVKKNALFISRVLLSIFLQNKNIWERVKENKYVQIQKKIPWSRISSKQLSEKEIKVFLNFYALKFQKNGRVLIWQNEEEITIMVECLERMTAIVIVNDLRKKIIKYLKNK